MRLRDTGETVGVHEIRKKGRLADLRRSESRRSSFKVVPARGVETGDGRNGQSVLTGSTIMRPAS